MTRAEFYGYHWYIMECLNGCSVDEWSMERAWERYQANPSEYEEDIDFQAAKARLTRKP